VIVILRPSNPAFLQNLLSNFPVRVYTIMEMPIIAAKNPNSNVLALQRLWPMFRKHGVRKAWLFGSRSRGDFRNDSDWDLLVEFASPPDFDHFMGLKLDLEDHLRTRVDLLSRSACHPRFLKSIQPELLDVA